jgi:hypothetical protein
MSCRKTVTRENKRLRKNPRKTHGHSSNGGLRKVLTSSAIRRCAGGTSINGVRGLAYLRESQWGGGDGIGPTHKTMNQKRE